MKKLMYVLGLSVLLFSGFASADKIAIVDVVYILQNMPQREAVGKVLDNEFASRVKVLQEEEKKADEADQKLKKDGMVLSGADKTKLNKVIQNFEEKAQAFSVDYRKRENEEVNKLVAKIQDAVKNIAAKDKYDLVLKVEAAFYANDAVDITEKVLEQVKK